MKSVLPSIIDEDQSGYLKGRYIGQNIRLLQDITFFTEINHISGLLMANDFEKAFDSLNWNFLLKPLNHFNFGSSFINLVKLMYNNIESTVLNNGNTGNYFKLFQNCSGLKININKTKAKYIGKILKPDHFPRGHLWIKTPLETLGIFITNDPDENYLLNYKPKFAELKNLLNIWKQRAVSLKGNITIINTLALAPLIYVASIIDIPKMQ